MDDIKNIVQNVIGKISSTNINDSLNIEQHWNEIINEKEKQHVKLSNYKDGRLYINVDSSAWLYQINLKKRSLLKELQKRSKNTKDIIIKIGKIK